MSDSSSDQGNNFDFNRISEQNRDHVKQILQKGKEIAPFYNDDILYNIYKRYFQSEKVFLNELRIIAKSRMQQQQQENHEEWISVGHTQTNKKKTNKINYNFLEDKKLIWRAENWEKQQAKHPYQQSKPNKDEEKNHEQSHVKNGKKKHYKKKQEQQEEKINNKEEQTPKEDKQTKKFKQKVGEKATKFIEKKEQQPKQVEKKNESKYVEKKSVETSREVPQTKEKKYIEKKESPKEKVNQSKKYTEKPTEQKEQPKEKVVEKKSQPAQKKPQPEQKKTVEKKPEPQKVEKVKKQQNNQEKTQKVQFKSDVAANFENSLKQYPRILKFIKPGEKTQVISYIRKANGVPEDVKIRIPLS